MIRFIRKVTVYTPSAHYVAACERTVAAYPTIAASTVALNRYALACERTVAAYPTIAAG